MHCKFEKYFRNYSPFHIRLKNFGELWSPKKKFEWLILTNPSGYPSGDYISAIRGCCALKFLNALETDQDYLAHPPQRRRGPPNKV